MKAPVELVAYAPRLVEHGKCVLCQRPYEVIERGWALLGAGAATGGVCSICVEEGPSRVAAKLRQRADLVRELAWECRAGLSAWRSTSFIQVLHQHASALDDLAQRVAGARWADWVPSLRPK
jgi:hypothetical protein